MGPSRPQNTGPTRALRTKQHIQCSDVRRARGRGLLLRGACMRRSGRTVSNTTCSKVRKSNRDGCPKKHIATQALFLKGKKLMSRFVHSSRSSCRRQPMDLFSLQPARLLAATHRSRARHNLYLGTPLGTSYGNANGLRTADSVW